MSNKDKVLQMSATTSKQSPLIINCQSNIDELSDQVGMIQKAKRIIIQLNDINKKQQQETEQYIERITQERIKDTTLITQLQEKINYLHEEKYKIDLQNKIVIDQLQQQILNLRNENDIKIKEVSQEIEYQKQLQNQLTNAIIKINQQEIETQENGNLNKKQINELKEQINKQEEINQQLNNQIKNFYQEKVDLKTQIQMPNQEMQQLKDEQKQNNITLTKQDESIAQQQKQMEDSYKQLKLQLAVKESSQKEKENLIQQIKYLEDQNQKNKQPEILKENNKKNQDIIETQQQLSKKMEENYQNGIQQFNLLQNKKSELLNDNQMSKINSLFQQLHVNLSQNNEIKCQSDKRILEKEEQIRKGEEEIQVIQHDIKRKNEELNEIKKSLDCAKIINDKTQNIINQLEKEKSLLSQIIQKLKIQEQQNQKNQEEQIVSLKEKPYEIVNEYSKKQQEDCYAIALNREQTTMVAGCGENKITVFEFEQGQLNQQQILSDHTSGYYIYSLYFMTKYNQFLSGTNKEIGIWSYNDITKQYYSLQMLKQAHQGNIARVIMNKNEDLIISCSHDKTIKFWIRKNEWKFSQTLTNHTNWVWDIYLNESCTQLVSCGADKQILISQQGGDQKWRKIQRIIIKYSGVRICYINDNLIAFQPFMESNMEIYQQDQKNKQFIKYKNIPTNNDGFCTSLFPMQFNNNKQLLLNKNRQNVYLIRKQNNDFIVEQSINFNSHHIYGTMTNDFKYLITWDKKSKEFQVRKQN